MHVHVCICTVKGEESEQLLEKNISYFSLLNGLHRATFLAILDLQVRENYTHKLSGKLKTSALNPKILPTPTCS